jgi:hypothetical protein
MSFEVTLTGDIGDCIAPCCGGCTITSVNVDIDYEITGATIDSDPPYYAPGLFDFSYSFWDSATPGGTPIFNRYDFGLSEGGPVSESYSDDGDDDPFDPTQIGLSAGSGVSKCHTLYIIDGSVEPYASMDISVVLTIGLSNGQTISSTLSISYSAGVGFGSKVASGALPCSGDDWSAQTDYIP